MILPYAVNDRVVAVSFLAIIPLAKVALHPFVFVTINLILRIAIGVRDR